MGTAIFFLERGRGSPFRRLRDVMVVYLRDGTPVQVDAQDAHILERPGWKVHKRKCGLMYVGRHENGKTVLLHRLILGLHGQRSPFVDHCDRDGMNNLRSNLRPCSHQQNLRNQFRSPAGKASRFKGLYWAKKSRKWAARICVDGKRIALGLFSNEERAAMAYNRAASSLFGEFARLNELEA